MAYTNLVYRGDSAGNQRRTPEGDLRVVYGTDLFDGAATVSGAGSVTAAAITGSGVMVDSSSAVSGVGLSLSTGTGALNDGASTVTGSGQVVDVSSGTLVDDPSVVSGVGTV